jgi:membrane protein
MAWDTYVEQTSARPLLADDALDVSDIAAAYRRESVGPLAASVALYTLLAAPALMLTALAIYGLVTPSADADVATLARVAPTSIAVFLGAALVHVASMSVETLSWIAVIAGAIALFAAERWASSVSNAVNRIAGLRDWRGAGRHVVLLGVGALGVALTLAALAGVVVLPSIAPSLGWDGDAASIWWVARWPAAFVVVGAYLVLLYHVAPARDSLTGAGALGGAAAGAALWVLATFGAALWVEHVGEVDPVIAAAATPLVALVWTYVAALAVLAGAMVATSARDRRKRALLVESAWND